MNKSLKVYNTKIRLYDTYSIHCKKNEITETLLRLEKSRVIGAFKAFTYNYYEECCYEA